MEEILKFTFKQYVKNRFIELQVKGLDGEQAYTQAAGEYVNAYIADQKQKAAAKANPRNAR